MENIKTKILNRLHDLFSREADILGLDRCRFCGKLPVDWDEDCDGEGTHEEYLIKLQIILKREIEAVE